MSASDVMVANGSCYPIELAYLEESLREWSVVVDIGSVSRVPATAKYMSVRLFDEEDLQNNCHRAILNNYCKVERGRDRRRSIIITEEGTVKFGEEDPSTPNLDWMWISNDGSRPTDHRPRKFFVANASGKTIKVQHVTIKGTPVERDQCVKPGRTVTLDYDRVKITYRGVPLQQQPIENGSVVRRSLIVCEDGKVKITAQLFGQNIEEKKWIVDGECFKKIPWPDRMSERLHQMSPIYTVTTTFSHTVWTCEFYLLSFILYGSCVSCAF